MALRGAHAIQKRIGRALLSLVLACAMCCFSLAGGQATPVGTQCPTAQTQLVLAPVYNSCGCVLRYEWRAPKPGDQSFVKCRCAEKKATQKAAVLSSRLDYFVGDVLEFAAIQPLAIASLAVPVRLGSTGRTQPPLVRPPAV